MSNEVTVVFAHGAWADGLSWAKVIEGLKAQGVTSISAAIPLTSRPDDLAAIDQAVERARGDVVVVGHAYAGAVVGGASSGKVKALVYITALAPDEGETVADVFYRTAPHPKAPQLSPDAHGFIYLPDDAFPNAFAPNASPAEQDVLRAVQRPIKPECITVKVERPRWKELPSWFLIAEDDHMILAETQRFMAERMKATVRSHKVDHTPSVTAPGLVVDIVMEAVRAIRH
ncbi:alpha/beta hydrolase [Labrys okinawensis]|uniref:alpha/beta hydrolase n=1 Tax=Labrys okinawensis TaxID=346911 RepID=UPI0039BCF14F